MKKMYWDRGGFVFTVFRLSRIEQCIENCAVLYENRLKC